LEIYSELYTDWESDEVIAISKEAQSRIKINKLLEEAGWRFFDNEEGSANISLELNVKLTQIEIDSLGNDFEKIHNGFVDYLLLDNRGFPIVVLEAKSESKNPFDGKEQARNYAKSQNARFIILSNGNLHYLWDTNSGNPYLITKFPTLESLGFTKTFRPNPVSLVREDVGEDYILLTQFPHYQKDPRWTDENIRGAFISDFNLKFLRPYQVRAINALQEAVGKGSDRFLFEMATGTGKTLVSSAVIKLFLRTGNAHRVLFLVDRLELEDQAWKNLVKYLKNDFKAVIYKDRKDDWRMAEIVVTTVQSLLFNNKYQSLFSPTDFDLVISDEAHRSIGGNSRAVFEYFVGYKLGLTATPKDYLKNLKEVDVKDPRSMERRLLLDTYKTFGCESGNPTFRYSLIEGVKDGYLVNPIVADARTEITTELLSEAGYSVVIETEDGDEGEQIFNHKDFEKKFFSEETNQILCKTFIENALRDPISGEIGKTIVFCVSQDHAAKIAEILNGIADLVFPGKYQSDFAVQVTSRITGAQQMTINFSDTNNNLNGHSKFLIDENYKTSRTRVCVTVGMMTTGYDCQDILNICIMRPIFSPSEFVQIKGRGTRKFMFTHTVKDEFEDEIIQKEKTAFKLFDFFAVCEYFEEKYNYDEVIKLPRGTSTEGGGTGPQPIPLTYTNFNLDPLKTFQEKAIGYEGMKIDRKLFEKFEDTIKANDYLRENFDSGDIDAIEKYIREEIFDKPDEYLNLDKLRKSLKLDRRISLREIIANIFGAITHFKTKDELLEEEFNKFMVITKPDSDNIIDIKQFFKAYITDSEVRDIVESGQFGRFATNPKVTLADFKALENWRDIIPEYVKDYVSLNTFM